MPSRALDQSRNCFAGDIPTDCPVCSGQVDLHPFLQKERMTWWVSGHGVGVVRNDTPHHLIAGQKTLKAKHQLIKVALRA